MSSCTSCTLIDHQAAIRCRRLKQVAKETNIPAEMFIKLLKNGAKAINEHNPNLSTVDAKRIVPLYTIIDPLDDVMKKVAIGVDEFTMQGLRPSMEDVHFVCETPEGLLVGLFDGHGGGEVASLAKDKFQREFSKMLQKQEGNVNLTFSALIQEIHKQVSNDPSYDLVGTTAVICFLKGSLIFTATLGDSEARNYRGEDVIPLSCVRNWKSRRDALRAQNVYLSFNDQLRASQAANWPKEESSKHIRYPSSLCGTNVSRAIGDKAYAPAVGQKCKVTVQRVNPGDAVVVACDGLWDVAKDRDITSMLPDISAKKLAEYASNNQSDDNISVILLKIS